MSYPFTPTGVSNQLADLYALTPAQLAVEAAAVKADLRTWLIDHFTLSNDQKTYLNKIPDSAIKDFADQIAYCFSHKLNISLIYPAPPAGAARSKYVEATNSTKITTGSDVEPTVTGELIFTMRYAA